MKTVGLYLNGETIGDVDQAGRAVRDDTFLLLFNCHVDAVDFTLPKIAGITSWRIVVDTNEGMVEPDVTLDLDPRCETRTPVVPDVARGSRRLTKEASNAPSRSRVMPASRVRSAFARLHASVAATVSCNGRNVRPASSARSIRAFMKPGMPCFGAIQSGRSVQPSRTVLLEPRAVGPDDRGRVRCLLRARGDDVGDRRRFRVARSHRRFRRGRPRADVRESRRGRERRRTAPRRTDRPARGSYRPPHRGRPNT